MKINKPKIICLCGSTRFKKEYIEANERETLAGNIVLTCGVFGHTDKKFKYLTEEQKSMLDELHKRKIDLADEVFVINVCGYMGSSTLDEVKYATKLGKKIKYLVS